MGNPAPAGLAWMRLKALGALVGLAVLIVGLTAAASAYADGSHFSVHFAAAEPTTYDHVTGEGGAYNDGTEGEDIVQSLEGGDFACGEIVVFFAAISVDPTETEEHTVELDFFFTGQSTGQPGVGFVDIVSASANSPDSGHVTDGDEAVSILDQTGGHPDGPLTGTVEITNLGVDDEQFILRVEANLGCTPGASPTGNLGAELDEARVTSPEPGPINTGQQTIPIMQAGQIGFTDYTLTKTANPAGPVVAGEEVGFDVTITNTGDAPLTDVVVTDPLPAGDALNWIESPDDPDCSIDPDEVLSCEFDTIEVGGERTVHVEAESNTASCGVLDNVADATEPGAGDRTDGALVRVICRDGPPPPGPGPNGDGPRSDEGQGGETPVGGVDAGTGGRAERRVAQAGASVAGAPMIPLLLGAVLVVGGMAIRKRDRGVRVLGATAIALGGLMVVAGGPPVDAVPDRGLPSTRGGAQQAPDALILPRSASQPDTGMRVLIPRIGVDARVLGLGLDADGSLQVPKQFGSAGWWKGGARPGDEGPAVIVGHVDSTTGPAVFHDLSRLRAGDEVAVTRPDGSMSRFVVQAKTRHPKAEFPTDRVYGHVRYAGLRLITCAGPFDSSTGHYRDNLIVFAKRAS